MKKTLIILALMAAGVASAQTTSSESQTTSAAGAASQAGAVGNAIYIDQSGPAQQTLSGTYNSTSKDDTHVNYSGTTTVKNVPGIAMSGPASGPCTGASGGVGLAGPGWGLGLNGAKVEPTCVVRENVRVIGMAMQSIDNNVNPQQKGEAMVMFMDSLRGLAAMNKQLLDEHVKAPK